MQFQTDELSATAVSATGRVWLVGSVISLKTFDHAAWCLEFYTGSVCFDSPVITKLKKN